jgi:hypothetical protein
VTHGEGEDRAILETLSLAWELLSVMPQENLTQLTVENLSRYHTRQKGQGQGNEFRQVCAHQEVLPRFSVGVESPAITARALPLQPGGLMWTDVSSDDARPHLIELVPILAGLGEAQTALWRLLH